MEDLKNKNLLSPKVTDGNLLSIDTSSESGSIALFEEGNCVSELNCPDVGTHSTWLLDNIDMLIESKSYSSQKFFDIDCFVTTTGPGSFTGLRIGITTLKGLAWAGDKPIISVSTLRAMAMNVFSKDTLICPILDARKGEIYGAIYKWNESGDLDVVVEDCLTNVDDFLRVVTDSKDGSHKGGSESVVFMGKGLDVYGDKLLQAVEGAVLAPTGSWNIRASVVAQLAIKGFGESFSATDVTPKYLREDSHGYKKANASSSDNGQKQVLSKVG